MIIGAAGFDLTPGLEVEKLSESTVFRGVEILLHQSERGRRPHFLAWLSSAQR
jgi:hypothetical protein